jgi:hypothetical protein
MEAMPNTVANVAIEMVAGSGAGCKLVPEA